MSSGNIQRQGQETWYTKEIDSAPHSDHIGTDDIINFIGYGPLQVGQLSDHYGDRCIRYHRFFHLGSISKLKLMSQLRLKLVILGYLYLSHA